MCSRFVAILVVSCATLSGTCLGLKVNASLGNHRADVGVYIAAVDWFTARQHCIASGFDDLDDAPLGSPTHVAIAQLLEESTLPAGMQLKFWTYFHRPFSNSTWLKVGCHPSNNVNVQYTDSQRCVAVTFSTANPVSFSAEVCTQSMHFLCLKKRGNINWHRTTLLADLDSYPDTWTPVTSNQPSEDACKSLCTGQCVVYRYSPDDDECTTYHIPNNEAYGTYTIILMNSVVTIITAGRQGVNVTLRTPLFPSIDPSPRIFPCSPALPATTTLTTHPTTVSTQFTQGPTQSTTLQTSTEPLHTSTGSLQTTTVSTTQTSEVSTSTTIEVSSQTTPGLTSSTTESTTPLPSAATSITTSPDTATETTTDILPLTIQITGYTGQYSFKDIHVYMQPMTWFEAGDTCKSELGGHLAYMSPKSAVQNERTSTLLATNGAYPNVPVWTNIFRQEADNKWYTHSCRALTDISEITSDITGNGGRCVYVMFYDQGVQPQRFSSNCTDKRPFACANNIDPVNFTEYPDYVCQTPPSDGHVTTRPAVADVTQCVDYCSGHADCVGISYLEHPGENRSCIAVMVNQGDILVYNISRLDHTVHYKKNKINGTFHPAYSTGPKLETAVWTQPPQLTTTFPYCPPAKVTTTKPTPTPTRPPKTCSCKLDSGVCPKLASPESPVTLREVLEQIVANLTVARDTTSAHRRRLVSAEDPRPSSSYIGTAAVVCIALVGGLIVLSDVVNILAAIRCTGRS